MSPITTADSSRTPPGPKGLHGLRLMRGLLAEPQTALDELNDRFGPVCMLGPPGLRLAVVGDPDALAELFAMSVDSFQWGFRGNVLRFVVGARSIIVSDGDDHRRRRGSVMKAFSRRQLNGWIPLIVEHTDRTIERLIAGDDPNEGIELYEHCRSLVLGIVVRSIFGEALAAHTDKIGALFQPLQEQLEAPAVRQAPHPLPFTLRSKARANRRQLCDLIDAQIAARRAGPRGEPDGVIQVLVDGGALSDAEIRDQAITLIGAGYHTTAASLAWMVARAALEPGVWQALGAEADEVFGAWGDGAVQDETLLARLELAGRVMRETLRLHPAGVLAPRKAVVDVRLGAMVIPKGTIVAWSPYLAGRDPRVWPDPLRFDPGRFVDAGVGSRHLEHMAWAPFGGGARACIGFGLAQMELTLIIARLAQRLDITLLQAAVPQPVGMVVNRPAGGVAVRVRSRHPRSDASAGGSDEAATHPDEARHA